MNGSSKKFSEQYSGKIKKKKKERKIQTGTRHNKLWKKLLNFDLRVCGKVTF